VPHDAASTAAARVCDTLPMDAQRVEVLFVAMAGVIAGGMLLMDSSLTGPLAKLARRLGKHRKVAAGAIIVCSALAALLG
jgi:hypothetical protein